MRAEAGLTQRETQIAELLAWGAAKKEVADRLSISPRTVENTARNIYSKIGIQKATELCVWWFCTHCGVSFDLSPIKRTIIACFFLAIILPHELYAQGDTYRLFRSRKATERTATRRTGRRQEYEIRFLGTIKRQRLMKRLIKELSLSGLTLKQKAIVWYFAISFCLLASTAEAPFWFLFLEVANFANAARLIKRVPLPEDPQDS